MPFDKDVWAWRLSGHNLHIDKGTAAAEPTHILYLWSHSRLAAALLDRACQQAPGTLPPDICAPVSCRIELPLMQTVWVFFKQSMNSISRASGVRSAPWRRCSGPFSFTTASAPPGHTFPKSAAITSQLGADSVAARLATLLERELRISSAVVGLAPRI